jgi:hypothetical protein
MRSKCEGPLGHMKHNIPDSNQLHKEGSVCACGHMKLTHIASCFAKGCTCKKYVSIKQ